jgi:glycosyltransferase involved in cell wall biosynthesis
LPSDAPLVLYVITRLCAGGASFAVRELARHISDTYRVHIVCGPDVGQEASIYEAVAAEHRVTLLPTLRRAVRPFDDLRAARGLRRIYRELAPAIIHTHSSKAGVVGRFAARGGDSAVVHTVHGWGHTPDDSPPRRAAFVAAERRVVRYTDALVAVSEDVRDEGLRMRIGARHHYHLIPAPVDLTPRGTPFAASRSPARRLLGIPGDSTVVGWVGRFMPQKDPETLVAVALELLGRHPDLHFVFIGGGPHQDEAEARIAGAGFAPRAHFTGFRPDVRSLYPAFDALVHTSRWEGQPLVIQEALAERIPVVTARVAGTRELLGTGDVGYEVDVGDVRAFVERLEQVLGDERLRAPLAVEDVQRIAANNGRDVSVERHLALYQSLLNGAD